MAIAITNQATTIKFDLGNGEEYHLDKDNLSLKKKFGFVYVHGNAEQTEKFTKLKFKYTDVSSPVVASNTELVNLLLGYKVNTGITIGNVIITDDEGKLMTLEPNGSLPVTLQDQTTPIVIAKLSHLIASTTISSSMAINDYSMVVANNASIVIGSLLTIFDPIGVRYTTFIALGISGTTITLDRPCDFAYPAGSFVDISDEEMANYDGSVTPVVFGLRNNAGATPPPGIDLSVDITRLIFECQCSGVPEVDMLGDIAGGLTRGLFCRRRDGVFQNIFNVKTNGEISGIMYDFSYFAADKKGTNGFASRLTFAGQNKMGVVIRLGIDEDIEVIIQDDLTDLVSLKIIAEGSIVEP